MYTIWNSNSARDNRCLNDEQSAIWNGIAVWKKNVANASSNRCCDAPSMWVNLPLTSTSDRYRARARRLGSRSSSSTSGVPMYEQEGWFFQLLDGPGRHLLGCVLPSITITLGLQLSLAVGSSDFVSLHTFAQLRRWDAQRSTLSEVTIFRHFLHSCFLGPWC